MNVHENRTQNDEHARRLARCKRLSRLSLLYFGGTALYSIYISAIGYDGVTQILIPVGFGVLSVLAGLTLAATRIRLRSSPIIILSYAALLLSVAFTHWPLRISFRFAETRLNAIAAMVERNERIVMPQSAGSFKICGVERVQNTTFLWVHPANGNPIGFMKCNDGDQPRSFWSQERMNDVWEFVATD